MARRAECGTLTAAILLGAALLLGGAVLPSAAQTASTTGEQLTQARDAHDNGDFELAFDLVAPLADIGIPEARHLLARLHLKRDFAGFDAYEAFRLMRLAAEQGLPIAQHDLAQMFRTGVGTDRDALSSFSWHLRAARQRFSLSERAIAAMYSVGEGVERNDAQAAKWAARAARSDQAVAGTGTGVKPARKPARTTSRRSPPAIRLPARTPPATVASASAAARTAPPAGAARSAATARTTSARSRYRVQLGAYRDARLANRVHAEILASLPPDASQRFPVTITAVDKSDGNGLLHRIIAGPVDDLATAQFVCRQVTSRLPRQGCFVLRSR